MASLKDDSDDEPTTSSTASDDSDDEAEKILAQIHARRKAKG